MGKDLIYIDCYVKTTHPVITYWTESVEEAYNFQLRNEPKYSKIDISKTPVGHYTIKLPINTIFNWKENGF